MSYSCIITSPIGKLGLTITELKLTSLTFLTPDTPSVPPACGLSRAIVEELNAYFINPRHLFTIHFVLTGTPFQKKVWDALQYIPSGHTLSYGELAHQLNTYPRAIGQACRANPLPIIIPCHRVVAKEALGGYAGDTNGQFIAYKTWLLKHEGIYLKLIANRKSNMDSKTASINKGTYLR